MATLPAATDFTGAAITEAQFKTAMTDLRTFLADQLGTAGTPAAALNALGALCNDYVAKSGAYTVIASDRGKLIGCTGTFTLTLTAAATLGDGFSFAVKNVSSGVITIDPNSAENIDGASASLTLGANESFILVCDGTAWQTVGKMTAATASVNGYMTSTYAAKLDGLPSSAVALDVGAGGVGMFALMKNGTGAALASNATAAGSSLNFAKASLADGLIAAAGVASGTWRHVGTSSCSSNDFCAFQRIV